MDLVSSSAKAARHTLRRAALFYARGGVSYGGLFGGSGLHGFLIDAEDVAAWVFEAGRDFGVVCADGLGDFAAIGEDGLEHFGGVVDHDVDEEAWGRGWAVLDERAADVACDVVEGGCAVASGSDLPVEGFGVEIGGARDVLGGEFDVADFSVGGGGHGSIL